MTRVSLVSKDREAHEVNLVVVVTPAFKDLREKRVILVLQGFQDATVSPDWMVFRVFRVTTHRYQKNFFEVSRVPGHSGNQRSNG